MEAREDPSIDTAGEGAGAETQPNQIEAQIRFALTDLSARNGAHQFEELCRHFSQARIASNILPATGPVAAGGDQGRDIETFKSFLRDELGPHGAFLGLVSEGTIVFACTLQQADIASKIRSDVESILSAGDEVLSIYAFCTVPVVIATRHALQKGVRQKHGVELEIIDQHGLAAQLASADIFWAAVQYLSLPASLAPPRAVDTRALPTWYDEDRDKWRERGALRPLLPDILDAKDGLRYATFNLDAREDLPFWIGLMRSALVGDAPRAIQQRARYEIAVATIRGIGDLRTAETEVRDYLEATIQSEHDPARLLDAAVVASYAVTAAAYGRTSIPLNDLARAVDELKARVLEELASDPPPTRTARLLQVRGHLGLLLDPDQIQPPDNPGTMPNARDLLDDQGELLEPRFTSLAATRDKLLDVDDAMDAWGDLADRLPDTPLFPVDELSDVLRILAVPLVEHPRWSAIVDAVDEAVARTEGAAAAAERARDRALVLYRAGRLRETLRELHRAKAGWWTGETLRGALLVMLAIADCYASLRLPLAAKQYALAAAYAALQDDEDLIPRAVLAASEADYVCGAWCSALELVDLGMSLKDSLADPADDEVLSARLDRAAVTLGMVLRAAHSIQPALVDRAEDVAQAHGALEPLRRVMEEVPEWDLETYIRLTDEQLEGRPFADIGAVRYVRFKALGLEWQFHCTNDFQHVLACERLASAAQIMSAQLADHDLCLLPTSIDVEVTVATDPGADEPGVVHIPRNNGRAWKACLTPLGGGSAMDPDVNMQELLTILGPIVIDLSLLEETRFLEVFEVMMERGLWHELAAVRPYDDLVAFFLTRDRFDAIRRTDLRPPADPRGHPLGEHPELQWNRGPGPTYSRNVAHEMVANRHERLPPMMGRTLPRLLSRDSFLETVTRLRADGWLDWHVLLGVYNVLLQFRLAHAGLNTREAMETADGRAAASALASSSETQDEPDVPLEAFSLEAITWGLEQALPTTLMNWDLHVHASDMDYPAVRTFLAERYAYWTDDIEHVDPFVRSGTEEPQDGERHDRS